jgi:CBS domain-containing protein
MLISDVLRTKGHRVERIHPTDSVELAVRKLAEHRIGALVVEDRWMKPVGIFSERDFINAVARDGAATLGFNVQQLMSTPILSRRSRNQTGRHAADAEPPRPYGRFWVIRRYTSARFVPADAGAKDKNPMGSMLFSASIIASSLPDCHQILRTSCQESVRK